MKYSVDYIERVIQDILMEDYYVDIWNEVKHTKPLLDCAPAELLEPFQKFWEHLPDTLDIRRPPFYNICNLAEEYVFGDEDE